MEYTKEQDERFVSDICYFWNKKQDITRYTGYDRIRLERLQPIILKAWDNYAFAKIMLDSLTKDK